MATMVGNPTGSVGEPGGVRAAAMAKAAGREPVNLRAGIISRGMSESEQIKNGAFGPKPPRPPSPQDRERVRAEFAEQRKDEGEARAKRNYTKGSSKPRPIPGARGEPRGAFTGNRSQREQLA